MRHYDIKKISGIIYTCQDAKKALKLILQFQTSHIAPSFLFLKLYLLFQSVVIMLNLHKYLNLNSKFIVP